MRLTHGAFERSDIWREGKWLDLWSLVHLLTGVSTAFGLSLFAFGFPASVVIAFLGFTAYELWEAMVKIEETPQNRVMDVVVGMASFVPTFLFVVPLFPFLQSFFVFGTVLAVNIIFAYVGWYASHKAKELEQRLRLDFIERRAQFHDIMVRRRARRAERIKLRQKMKA